MALDSTDHHSFPQKYDTLLTCMKSISEEFEEKRHSTQRTQYILVICMLVNHDYSN